MKDRDCLICKRIEMIKGSNNKYFVKELETGYVVIGDYQFYEGYALFLCKLHATEIHELEKEFRLKFLEEMSIVAEAVFKAFKPNKLNYELLGNTDKHLHWHLFPRYSNDLNPKAPVWAVDKEKRMADSTKPTSLQLENLKKKLLVELDKLIP